uniref:Uncharacterized protein n=1 Tax=Varanus komodoensis TaxID=61221 RepID=A0A8D2LNK9_VARKO
MQDGRQTQEDSSSQGASSKQPGRTARVAPAPSQTCRNGHFPLGEGAMRRTGPAHAPTPSHANQARRGHDRQSNGWTPRDCGTGRAGATAHAGGEKGPCRERQGGGGGARDSGFFRSFMQHG